MPMVIHFARHSPTAQAAYHDLLSLLQDDAFSDMKGNPTRREINGHTYWYDRYRIGNDIRERYLGEDTPLLRQRLDRHEELRATQNDRRRERSRLVRILRSERLLGTDGATGSLLAAFAKAGVFRLGGVLVGTNAFRGYEGELGLRLGFDQLAMTNDIDVASFDRLSVALDDTTTEPVGELLRGFEFEAAPSLDAGKVWRWRQSRSQTLVEFLTPPFRNEERIHDLAPVGVSAQSLHYLDFILAEPIHAAAVYRDGVLIRIPRPERYAVHKLIVADRRIDGPDSIKSRKDIMQAELLMAILAQDRPLDLTDAYDDAMSRGPRWRERLQRSLGRSPNASASIEQARQSD